MTSFFYRKMYFEVRCACSDGGEIIGAYVRANRNGKDVEVFTKNRSVYFFPYCDRQKLRMSARRQAYGLIRYAK